MSLKLFFFMSMEEEEKKESKNKGSRELYRDEVTEARHKP